MRTTSLLSRLLPRLAALAFTVEGASSCRADVVYSNFSVTNGVAGPGLYVPQWSVYEAGSSLNLGIAVATPFTVTGGNYALSSVSLVLAQFEGQSNLTISLHSDVAGLPNDVSLETLATDPGNLGAAPQAATYSSSLQPLLHLGAKYWLIVGPHSTENTTNSGNNAVYGWHENNSAVMGSFNTRAYNFDVDGWDGWTAVEHTLLPAFRIEGTLVPEPGTLWLLFGGLGILSVYRRSKRRLPKS